MTGETLRHAVEALGFHIIPERSRGEEICFICPVPGCPDESGNRAVNLRNGKTHCWRCNSGGDFIKWARFLGFEISEDSAIAGVQADDVINFINQPAGSNQIVPVISGVDLPEGFTRCCDDLDSVYTELIGEMAVRKNLNLEALLAVDVGFTRRDEKWEPYAIFPVIEYGRIVYFQGRTYDDGFAVEHLDGKTKRFPGRGEAPLSSKYWVYNIDALQNSSVRIAVVVESILNVLSLKRKFDSLGIVDMVPVCVFKSSISKPQFFKLRRFKHLEECCFLFDLDATGKAWESSVFVDDLMRVSIAEMPVIAGRETLDANDDVETAWQAITRRIRYSAGGRAERAIMAAARGYYAVDARKLGSTRS